MKSQNSRPVHGALQPPLEPRRGKVLQVLGIARISRVTQNEKSLDDQHAFYCEYLQRATDLEFEIKVLAGIGSGESLERKEYLQAWEEVESEKYDLVICEDLGRLARRVHAQLFCEHAIDHGSRVIAINDQLDTSNENWTQIAGLSAIRHSMYNADTAKRIRRSHRNRFMQGEMIHLFSWGYIVPPGALYDHEITVDHAAATIIDRVFTLLEEGWNYAMVADWLNQQGVPLPKYCRVKKWTAGNVPQFFRNTILKGVRVRNMRMCIRIHKTGKHKTIPAPESERLQRVCPNLVIIEPTRFDRVMRLLDARNGKFKRKPQDGADPRLNVPRKRTVWPGQHLICGVCGRVLHYGAHGLMQNLICSGVREYECWNAVSVNGPIARSKLIEAIIEAIASLPDFDSALISNLTQAIEEYAVQQNQRLVEEQTRLAKLECELKNLIDALAKYGLSDAIKAKLTTVEQDVASSKEAIEQLSDQLPETPPLPSMSEIKYMAKEALQGLAAESEELGQLLQKWIPKIRVLPFQLLQHGQPVQRAFFTLDLTSFLPCQAYREKFGHLLQQEIVVDLFDMPAREKLRPQIVKLKREGYQHRQIATMLGTYAQTVYLALKLQLELESLGITDPVLPLIEPPANDNKWRRHRHVRFQFKPLPGYPMRLGD
jgi:DNA invertase Pin-like site-specific DNA recombinase